MPIKQSRRLFYAQQNYQQYFCLETALLGGGGEGFEIKFE